jgi:hypothetical protein
MLKDKGSVTTLDKMTGNDSMRNPYIIHKATPLVKVQYIASETPDTSLERQE